MSLPPGFLDELRSRVSLAQVVGRKVTWDRRKSNQGRGDMWAPCPFHQEKTASFHVDDRKGFYYCFGCHEKGDAISFVRQSENVGFMEAVEILAREAGMQMPARDPAAQQKADRRSVLSEVLERAIRHYRLQLSTAAGAPARDYLARRGLSPETLERWEIGFAPPGWQGLWDHLTAAGVAPDDILEAGLARPSDQGRQPYDVFRNRIMFPIRDAQGRAIAFGARALDPDEQAKYLNSPETPLFDKGRTLYNHGPARQASGKGRSLVVAEGYMDVIALSEAGFPAAVAPLGTAVTEAQLALLWRLHEEPIVALDGDRAGLNAAYRLIELALPLLAAGKSLRFALMPAGRDPDDVIRSGGPAAMQKVLDAAQPMVRLLWQHETEGHDFDSPERRAALDRRLRERVRSISDPSIRRHYGEEIDRLRRALFRPEAPRRAGGAQRRPFGPPAPAKPAAKTRGSLLAAGDASVEETLRLAVIVATLVVHPYLIEPFLGDLERLEPADPDLARTLAALLRFGPGAGQAALTGALGEAALEKLFSPRHVVISPSVRHGGNAEIARQCLEAELAKHLRLAGARREIAEASEDIAGQADEGLTWRLRQAAEGQSDALRGRGEDRTEYIIAENGLRIPKDEQAVSRAVFDRIDFARGGRKPRAQG